ncbi:MAG: FCD domain-containing protein [Deltaproteobacteria bacterium]|jgi:GntR family transcriptional repressor for pyruvate dehydrogenase complex|nr:FCD domain-containing protein [Deltaproteobacteria bacterium]
MLSSEQPIRPKKLHEQVAERLRAMIIERRLLPGDRLPSERELQTLFGIGRPAVREGLLLLEHSGLIALRSGSPATVTSASPENILKEIRVAVDHFLAEPAGVRELQAARNLLECGLARRAARKRSDDDLALMRDILEHSKAALDDTQAFETLDLEFHCAIMQVSGSKIFAAVFQAMNDWLREQRTMVLSLPGQTDIALDSHQAVYNAIKAQDPEMAERVMARHLGHVEQTYWAATEAVSRRARAVAADTRQE